MSTPFANAVNALWRSIKSAGGVSVVYNQGATSLTATATLGRSASEVETTEGVIRSDMVHDFIFHVSDLLGLLPRRGDTIAWDGKLFEVLQPGGGRQYDYSDQYRTLLRVHTKEINAG